MSKNGTDEEDEYVLALTQPQMIQLPQKRGAWQLIQPPETEESHATTCEHSYLHCTTSHALCDVPCRCLSSVATADIVVLPLLLLVKIHVG